MEMPLERTDLAKLLRILTHDLLNQIGLIDLNLQLLADESSIGVSGPGSPARYGTILTRASAATLELTNFVRLIDTVAESLAGDSGDPQVLQDLFVETVEAHIKRFGDPRRPVSVSPGNDGDVRITSDQEGLFDPERESFPLFLAALQIPGDLILREANNASLRLLSRSGIAPDRPPAPPVYS